MKKGIFWKMYTNILKSLMCFFVLMLIFSACNKNEKNIGSNGVNIELNGDNVEPNRTNEESNGVNVESNNASAESDEKINIKDISSLPIKGAGEWFKGKDGNRYFKNSYTFYDTFDTVITVTLYSDKEEDFQEDFEFIHDEYLRLNNLYDSYNSYEGINNVKTINDSAGKKGIKVETDLFNLLRTAKEYYDISLGKTNVAMGAVLKLWHEERENNTGKLPNMDALKEAGSHTDINNVLLDEEKSEIFLKDEKMSLDVGAFAKGYATEIIYSEVKSRGIKSGIINAGGNVKFIGKPIDGREDWITGIQNPDTNSDNSMIASIAANPDDAVVTSGAYQRFYVVNDKKYHHIIDPATLMPGDYYNSVTIKTMDSGLADFLSTAMFLSTEEEQEKIIESVKKINPSISIEAVYINKNNEIKASEGLKNSLQLY